MSEKPFESRWVLLSVLKRAIEIATALVAIGLVVKLFDVRLPEWLERIVDHLEILHAIGFIIVAIVLWAVCQIIDRLVHSITSGISEQVHTFTPHLWLVTKATHPELLVFSSDFVTLSGAFVNAIGRGSVDFAEEPFSDLLKDHSRHYSEFLYYWLIESVLFNKAESVESLKMMHYLCGNGMYPIFIRRFQKAQRRIPRSAVQKKIYRFRSNEDYDRSEYTNGRNGSGGSEYKRASQIQWSELLMEELAVGARVVIDHGSTTVKNHSQDNICETIVISFKHRWSRFGKRTLTRLVAVAEKDTANFEFQSGRIRLERER